MNQRFVIILIIIIAALLTGRAEWRRPNRIHRKLRLAALLTALAALTCLILPVSYHSSATRISAHQEAVLLTEGFNQDSLADYSNLRIYTLNREIHQRNPKVILVDAVASLNNLQPAVTALRILGNGLNADELQQLHVPVIYHQPPAPAGITSVSWTARLTEGQQFQVQGRYHNTAAQPVKLLLRGLNTILDSVTLPAHRQTAFGLSAVPKNTGRAAYSLLAVSGSDTSASEPLPFNTEPVKPIRVLLLAETPGFENKFLKNWLSQNGYAAAVRSAVSKSKTSQEFMNIDKFPLDKLSAAALERFDVIVSDLTALKALPPPENEALQQQISQKGLGLIIRTDSSGRSGSWLQTGFSVTPPANKKQVTAALKISGSSKITAKLNIDAGYVAAYGNTQPVITDQQNHVLAGSRLAGAGKVIFTSLTQTFSWALGGNQKDYTAVWTSLLNAAARKKPAAEYWQVASALPQINQPVQIYVQTGTVPDGIKINQDKSAPLQNSALPFEWAASGWPGAAGWQQASSRNGTFWWYAFAKNDWKTIQNIRKSASTYNYAANHPANTSVTKLIQQNIIIEVPKFYFYALLLLSCCYLWAENRWLS